MSGGPGGVGGRRQHRGRRRRRKRARTTRPGLDPNGRWCHLPRTPVRAPLARLLHTARDVGPPLAQGAEGGRAYEPEVSPVEFLFDPFLGKPTWLWLVFIGIVVALLVFDLGVLHRKEREIEVAESLWMSAGYIAIALLFGLWILLGFPDADEETRTTMAVQYFTGFFVEKTLAMDNVFVISLIFTYFAIPRLYQHRVLFWGILGVIVLRAIMIGFGAALVTNFSWILYIFGAFLIFTGIKMLVMQDQEMDVSQNPVLKFMRKRMNVTDELHGNKFFVRLPDPKTGQIKRFATPLFLALVLVEIADVIFAVDSVPAIFAITTDPFIVYTSNIFAILGLRALYFALAAMVHRFHYLKYALSIVLVFIGAKIFYNQFFGKMDPVISLSVTLALLVAGVLFSLYKTRGGPPPVEQGGARESGAH
jgi:tellurite resistance protein TerC